MENVVPRISTGEVAVAVTSDSHLKTRITLNFPPFLHSYGGIQVLNPSKESIAQLEHISMTLSYQKPVPFPLVTV